MSLYFLFSSLEEKDSGVYPVSTQFFRVSWINLEYKSCLKSLPLVFIPGADDGGALFRLSDWLCGLPGTLPERHHGSTGFWRKHEPTWRGKDSPKTSRKNEKKRKTWVRKIKTEKLKAQNRDHFHLNHVSAASIAPRSFEKEVELWSGLFMEERDPAAYL